jgi:hypothetical protein
MSSAGTIMLEDIQFGDVWICSEQSNMQFTLVMVRLILKKIFIEEGKV